jgi:hypothetical protein
VLAATLKISASQTPFDRLKDAAFATEALLQISINLSLRQLQGGD